MIDLTALTIEKAAAGLRARDFSARELTESYLTAAHQKNAELNAYLELFDEEAGAQADAADVRLRAGEREPLLGVPLAVKDNILIEGQIASAGSRILENHRAVYDASVITNLKKRGVVFLGRTNMDEFAHGTSTENSAFGPTKNPHDLSRVPGGSSGGTAAAVAADLALAGLGTDSGGSCRQPAALCGVVGFKPSYGAVSRSGLVAMGSSLDQLGTIAKSVRDVELLFEAERSHDPLDATSEDYEVKKFRPSGKQAKRIGVPKDFIEKGLSQENEHNFAEVLTELRALGYELKDVAVPSMEYSLPVYYIICPAEVSTNLARYDGIRYGLHLDGARLLEDYLFSRAQGFGREARRRVMLGTYVLSHGYYEAYYNKARAIRQCIVREFDALFTGPEAVGAVITPTTTGPAFKIGEKVSDPIAMYLEDVFTVTANIYGGPAISVPSGFVEREGVPLPLGVQFMAPHFGEELLFQIGKALGK